MTTADALKIKLSAYTPDMIENKINDATVENLNNILNTEAGFTLAHIVAALGDNELLLKIKEKEEELKHAKPDFQGIDWTQQDSTGKLPAHYAGLYNKNPDVVMALVANPENTKEKDNNGKTALDYVKERTADKLPDEEVDKIEEAVKGLEGDEGESHDPKDDLNNEEGETHIPINPEKSEDSNTEESDGGTPTGKKVFGALKDATDNFFKAVFEANHKTAEEFAQAFLMSLLAFPLDVVGTYLEKKYDKSETDLRKEILNEMRANKAKEDAESAKKESSNESELTEDQERMVKAIFFIWGSVKEQNPELWEKVKGLSGKKPEEVKKFFEENKETFNEFKDFMGKFANTDDGKLAIRNLFPKDYKGDITPEKAIKFLMGEIDEEDKGKDSDKGDKSDDKDDKGGDKDKKDDKDEDKKLPFKLPEKMDDKIRGKILSSYAKLVNSSKDENKVKAFTDFINSKEADFQEKVTALELIQNHKKLLEGLTNKNGDLSIKKFDKYNSRLDGEEKLNKENVKLALGLLKRLEQGSKDGDPGRRRGERGR